MKLLSFVVLFVVVAIAFGQSGRGRPQNGPLGGRGPFDGRGNKGGSQDNGRDREGRGHRHNSRSSSSSSSSSEEHRSRPTGATASNRPASSATTTVGYRPAATAPLDLTVSTTGAIAVNFGPCNAGSCPSGLYCDQINDTCYVINGA